MNTAHELILVGGVLGLISVFAVTIGARFNAPILLIFLLLGMLAGEDGPGRIQFADFQAAYLIGSIALAIILFEGGLKTERTMIRIALWPSVVLATVGVVLTAAVVGSAAVWLFPLSWTVAFPRGAIDEVNVLITVVVIVKESCTLSVDVDQVLCDLISADDLEVESGLNDPMSVFLTVLLVQSLESSGNSTIVSGVIFFLEEMVGGAIIGLLGGLLLLRLLRKLPLPADIYPVLALACVLVVFGGAQLIGASGFLAVYLMGIIVGVIRFESQPGCLRVPSLCMVGADRSISHARLAGDTPYADSACSTDSPDHGSARPDRATGSHFRLSAAVRLFGTSNRLRFVGPITRSCSYLPDHHSRARWFAQRCSFVRRHHWRHRDSDECDRGCHTGRGRQPHRDAGHAGKGLGRLPRSRAVAELNRSGKDTSHRANLPW